MPELAATQASKRRFFIFIGIFGSLIAVLYSRLPVKERAGYYEFADQTQWLGIPHSIDVVSNIAFAIVGVWGLLKLKRASGAFVLAPPDIRGFKTWTSIAILLTAFGSAYFHLEPGIDRVYWDRLPMVLAFGGIIGWVIADKVDLAFGWIAGLGTFVFGSIALTLWRVGLLDLRPYFILQYGGFVLVVYLCATSKLGVYSRTRFIAAMAIYAFAKVFEIYDTRILETLGFISGHSLKHLAAAYSIHLLLSAKEQ